MLYQQQIYNLCNQVEEKLDFDQHDFKDLESKFLAIPEYFNSVIAFNVQMPMIQARYDGEEFRDKVSQLDQRRRDRHEGMTIAVNYINRLCDACDMKRIFNTRDLDYTSRDDRAIAADICFKFCSEIFMNDRQRQQIQNIDDIHSQHEYIGHRSLDDIIVEHTHAAKEYNDGLAYDMPTKINHER